MIHRTYELGVYGSSVGGSDALSIRFLRRIVSQADDLEILRYLDVMLTDTIDRSVRHYYFANEDFSDAEECIAKLLEFNRGGGLHHAHFPTSKPLKDILLSNRVPKRIRK